MKLTFWGVRGSIPTPGKHTVRYTNGFELPSPMGGSMLLSSINTLSTCSPAIAASTCSTVCTRATIDTNCRSTLKINNVINIGWDFWGIRQVHAAESNSIIFWRRLKRHRRRYTRMKSNTGHRYWFFDCHLLNNILSISPYFCFSKIFFRVRRLSVGAQ